MPSEMTIAGALEALKAPAESFRSVVAAAANEVGGRLAARRDAGDGRVARTAIGLGTFGARWVNAERFSALFGDSEVLNPLTLARVERAVETLNGIARSGDEIFTVHVPPGGDLRDEVGAALARAGAAFAAAREAELARLGRPPRRAEDAPLTLPFRYWNRAERSIAPPLVVEVDGGDAQASGLAEFLDGGVKIVLLVRGAAPPALLARLITPGLMVVQSDDPAELSRLAATEAPAIAALVEGDAAHFIHTPGDGPVWERLEVKRLPAEGRRSSLGSFSTFQQSEEVALLRTHAIAPVAVEALGTAPLPAADIRADQQPGIPELTVAPAVASNGEERAAPLAPPVSDPAGRLADWLLSQSGIASPG
jgi:hypothetical protein